MVHYLRIATQFAEIQLFVCPPACYTYMKIVQMYVRAFNILIYVEDNFI